MWLLDVKTLELKEFFGHNIPPYVILSHTWGPEEVSFVEMKKWKYREMAESKAGFIKIKGCCDQARRDGFAWAWVDSCAIDKRSSAELSEAINSMFQWYKDSDRCYVYLSDVPSGSEAISMLKKSRWFTRGWTLQELVAPRKIVFFAQDWSPIGYQARYTDLFDSGEISINASSVDLTDEISTITNIPRDFLTGERGVSQACVAQRMFWASRRETTRAEDRAYSLMGLFNISMPVIYGEGLEKAFERLQREIVTKTTDQSILAWHRPDTVSHSLLAQSPDCFKASGTVTKLVRSPWLTWTSFSMTNLGLRITLRMKDPGPLKPGHSTEALLDCCVKADDGKTARIGLRLHFLSMDFEGRAIFICERLQTWTFCEGEGYPMSMFLRY